MCCLHHDTTSVYSFLLSFCIQMSVDNAVGSLVSLLAWPTTNNAFFELITNSPLDKNHVTFELMGKPSKK